VLFSFGHTGTIRDPKSHFAKPALHAAAVAAGIETIEQGSTLVTGRVPDTSSDDAMDGDGRYED